MQAIGKLRGLLSRFAIGFKVANAEFAFAEMIGLLAGFDKSRAVEQALGPAVLDRLGLGTTIPGPNEIEIWGDRFSEHAGTDWLMCKPIDRRIRAISFRDEDPKDFPEGYNIRLWDGAYRLQEGLLEFLEGRTGASP